MSKIGIITFHRAINYGAVLQTYALNNFINNSNHICETIDYRCKYIENEYNLFDFSSKKIKKNINALLNCFNTLQRKKKFNSFIKEYIKVSEKKYLNNNLELSNNIYDIFITGSDQIWNIDLCKDEMYFLPFVNNKKKVSYAASFGNRDIIKNRFKLINKYLSDFELVTVRENSAVEDLKKFCGIDGKKVVDPTFLLDGNEWNSIVKKNDYKEKYILVYVLHENSLYEVAKKISNKMNIPVYVISQSRKKRINGKYIRNAGPLEFLSLIKNCEYVITDSFHGTALGIIFRKNLKVVLKKENIYLNDRLLSVLKEFKLEHCIVNPDNDINTLIKPTNYCDSEKLIHESIENSKKVLLDSIA